MNRSLSCAHYWHEPDLGHRRWHQWFAQLRVKKSIFSPYTNLYIYDVKVLGCRKIEVVILGANIVTVAGHAKMRITSRFGPVLPEGCRSDRKWSRHNFMISKEIADPRTLLRLAIHISQN